ncbi:extracellular solute-binding protein [Jeotgalibaca ciconiae]|uniref:Extracellular solute-binding protein n=1 Tax=Jeotgalibaca ciconiae TaxID=2496265 RepID=A0A3Q9BJA5_9LACT|nr:extracellular solute-binding protein [Jeotgalibaca ciconiae]AZP03581.1 extracellular solute-binding protein [Jeotgalibaca ciconiae]
MNKMNKKIIRKAASGLMLTGLATAVLAGCSGGSSAGEAGSNDRTEEITMLVLGDKPNNGRLESMLEELNGKLEEKVNATLDLHYVEWADWQTQYNVELLSGDGSIDLITTATDWLYGWENAQKGAFLPLTEEMLKENAPKTWEQVSEFGDWDLTKLEDGNIYFIPEDNYKQYTNHGFFYRGDWATEAGLPNGEITKFDDLTAYFEYVLENKDGVVPWETNAPGAGIDAYVRGNYDYRNLIGINVGNYEMWQTEASDPYTVTSYLMEGNSLKEAAEEIKNWNDMGVWREDVLNFTGDSRELFYSGQAAVDQHHTQTYIGQIVYNMNTKQPGSDPKMYAIGQENNNIGKDLKTHGALAVSASSKNPEKALQVYDLLRNDEECYRLINYGIEGTDYIVTEDGNLDYPEGYDPSTDSLGSNFWAGRMDNFELDKTTDAPNKDEIYSALDEFAYDYPFENLIFNKDAIESSQSAMANVLSTYMPQLQAGKFEDPSAEIDKMREELKSAGYDEVLTSLQADMDTFVEQHDLK